jgi:hypothetical protein
MPETTAPRRPTERAHRRCWRCLQQFTTDPPVPVREDFWLCDPGDAGLLPTKRHSS